MNRKKAILLLALIQGLLLGVMCALFASGIVKPLTFTIIIAVLSVVFSALFVIVIRKLPPM